MTETNREIAEAICGKLYYDVEGGSLGGEFMAHEDNLSVIEEALHAKDKAAVRSVVKAHALGIAQGAADMRDRAAKAIEHNIDGLIPPEYVTVADFVRSLPLHAEQKDGRNG